MKQFFAIILCSLALCRAEDAPYATPEEFGSVPLQLQAAEHIIPTDLRPWQIAGQPPLRAALVRMQGKWGKDARVTLRTSTGRTIELPVTALSDADLEAVRSWMQQNQFITIRTLRHGDHTARLLSVSYTAASQVNSNGSLTLNPGKRYMLVRMAMQDGTILNRICVAEPLKSEAEIRNQSAGVWVLQEETRLNLLRYMQEHPQPSQPEPLPIAANLPEALACAALRDVSIVYITLGPRGCEADKALRRYMKEHPEAGAIWAQRHVFLISYRDSQDKLPRQCLHDIRELNWHHAEPTTYDFSNETPYDIKLHSQQITGWRFVQPVDKLTSAMNNPPHHFQISPAELQHLHPADISFGPFLLSK
ncbi:MAG: hypothetical protein IJB33_03025 [Akkermansia sp.]|nr:hypothetical protein [Akkermansia sp.]